MAEEKEEESDVEGPPEGIMNFDSKKHDILRELREGVVIHEDEFGTKKPDKDIKPQWQENEDLKHDIVNPEF